MSVISSFDRIGILHLPERRDRYRSIRRELARAGIDIQSAKVRIPVPYRPEEANGFASRAVHGNYLSHLGILRSAMEDGVKDVLVLEDDALFNRVLCGESAVGFLEREPWDMCFFGHTLDVRKLPAGLIRYSPAYGDFRHAHCYAVTRGCLPRLIDHLEASLRHPPGHPTGGRVYIDGAFNHFRRLWPEIVTLVASPIWAKQKGCRSSISDARWFDRMAMVKEGVQILRRAGDEWWRFRSRREA